MSWNDTELIFGARGRNRTGTVSLPRDFKSLASTNFATRAGCAYSLRQNIRPKIKPEKIWRRGSESNRRTLSCSQLHNHSATAPFYQKKPKLAPRKGAHFTD